MKFSGMIVCAILTTIGSQTSGANRFPVVIHGTVPHEVQNESQFYDWADEWGASIYHGGIDSISKFKIVNHLDFEVSAAHFARVERIYLTVDSSLMFYQGKWPWMLTYTRFDPINTAFDHGYSPGSFQLVPFQLISPK